MTCQCKILNLVCVTHKKKLCHECHFNKLCEKSGKKECQVLKVDEFEELVAKSMGEVDVKVQEAIDSITAHGKRIKNILKNDPVNNQIDENWKLNLQTKEMLVQDKNIVPNPNPKTEPKIDSKTESKTESKAETQADPKAEIKSEPKNEGKNESKKQLKKEPKKTQKTEKSDQAKNKSQEQKSKRSVPPKNGDDKEIDAKIMQQSKNLTIQISNIEPDKTMAEWFAIKGEWVQGKLQQRNASYHSKALCHVSFSHERIKEYFR